MAVLCITKAPCIYFLFTIKMRFKLHLLPVIFVKYKTLMTSSVCAYMHARSLRKAVLYVVPETR